MPNQSKRRSRKFKNLVVSIFLICDVLAITAFYNLFHYLRLGAAINYTSVHFFGVVTIVLLALYVMDIYRSEELKDRQHVSLRGVFAVFMAGLFSTVYIYLLGPYHFESEFGRGVLPITLLAFSVWVALTRYIGLKANIYRKQDERGLFIGGVEKFEKLHEDFELDPNKTDLLVDGKQGDEGGSSNFNLFTNDSFYSREHSSRWDWVVIPEDHVLTNAEISRLMDLRQRGVHIFDLTSFYEQNHAKVPIFHLEQGWFVEDGGFSLLNNRTGIRLKRIIDCALSLGLGIALLPLMLVVAVVIKLSSPGPIFYRQRRVGYNAKPFYVYKFRTMINNAETSGAQWASKDDARITIAGKFLRPTRVDELPQLWNVIKGEMSFIGPRPERPEFVETLENEIPFYDLRHLIKPGITGWAQVMYPYGASVDDAKQKLQYDLYYIKNYSLLLDFYILFKTIKVVFSKSGR